MLADEPRFFGPRWRRGPSSSPCSQAPRPAAEACLGSVADRKILDLGQNCRYGQSQETAALASAQLVGSLAGRRGMTETRKRAVVLLSGGLDSTTTLAIAKAEG